MAKHTHFVQADPAATGTTLIDHVAAQEPEGSSRVERVIVEQTGAADASWNIEFGGNDAFSSEQSVSSADTAEEFIPDQNLYQSGATTQLAVAVSAAGSAGNLNVTVVTNDGRGE